MLLNWKREQFISRKKLSEVIQMKLKILVPIFALLLLVSSVLAIPSDYDVLQKIGHITGAGSPNMLSGTSKLIVEDGVAYVLGETDDSLTIFNVTDPENIVHLSNTSEGDMRDPVEIYLHNDIAYIGDWWGNFITIDVSDPSNPVYQDMYNTGYNPVGIVVKDYGVGEVYAFVAGWTDWFFYTFNVTDPANITLLHTYEYDEDSTTHWLVSDWDLVFSSDNNYVYSHSSDDITAFFSINITDPLDPSIPDNNSLGFTQGVQRVEAIDDIAVVIADDEGFTLYNMSDPADIRVIGQGSGKGSPNYLDITTGAEFSDDSNTLYVTAETDNALTSWDITDKTSPSLISSVVGTGSPNYLSGAREVDLWNDYIFVVSNVDNALVSFSECQTSFELVITYDWESCLVNNTQYRTLSYNDTACEEGIVNETESLACDYCTPLLDTNVFCNTWEEDCPTNYTQYCSDINNTCYNETGLGSDVYGQAITRGCVGSYGGSEISEVVIDIIVGTGVALFGLVILIALILLYLWIKKQWNK